MSDKKVAFVVNENDRLIPFLIEIEKRDGSEYVMEREFVFLTDVDYESEGARGFAQGMSVGHFLKVLEDAEAKRAEVGSETPVEDTVSLPEGGGGTGPI